MAIGTPTIGTWTETTSGASHAIPYPSTVAAGACLVLVASQSSAGSTIFTVPGGWTQVAQLSVTTNTVLPVLFVAIKPNASGTEGGTTLTVTHSTGAIASWQILAFPGVDTVTPQDVAATTVDSNVAATSTVLPALTVVTANAALVAAGAMNSTTATATPPSGFTETGDRVSNARAMEVSYLLAAPLGSTGTETISWGATSAKSVGVLLALRPAPGVLPELVMANA